MSFRYHQLFKSAIAVCCAILLLVVSGCCCCGPCSTSTNLNQPSVFDDLSEDSTETVDPNATAAAEVNKYFPSDADGYEVLMTGEKQGTTMADLKSAGELVATLAVFDTVSNEDARTKYASATDELQGFPLVHQGNKSMVLVGDRFQITVQSKGDTFTQDDRVTWLKKFDLGGLAGAE